MSQNDFIFSNKFRHRIARHATFWMGWLLFYLLFFHYPVHTFKGWSFTESSATLHNIGPLKLILKTLFFNALLGVVVPNALFIYLLLYWVLPNFFYRKRNPFILAGVTVAFLMAMIAVSPYFKIMVIIGNRLFGNTTAYGNNFSYAVTSLSVIRELFTSFPIVLGFALLIKLMKRWWMKQSETTQLAKEKATAELQLLKAQVHPHFLFNTLNNIYYFILKGSSKAPEMINKLSELLHYIVNECNPPMVPLEKEIEMIKSYMELEKIRYGEQMKMDIAVYGDPNQKLVSPLLLIPFVENSFKHGTSHMLDHPWVKLRIHVENDRMIFFISNSHPHESVPQLQKGNIGLNNVKRRLKLLYPGGHDLKIIATPDSFTVHLDVQLKSSGDTYVMKEGSQKANYYAMA